MEEHKLTKPVVDMVEPQVQQSVEPKPEPQQEIKIEPQQPPTFDIEKIRSVLKALEKSQTRWCAETVDDAEDMWQEIPGLLDWAVNELRVALNLPVFVYKAVYGIPGREVDVTRFLQVYKSSNQIRIRTVVTNTNFKCDPVPGIAKRLVVTYSYGETNKKELFAEGIHVSIDIDLV